MIWIRGRAMSPSSVSTSSISTIFWWTWSWSSASIPYLLFFSYSLFRGYMRVSRAWTMEGWRRRTWFTIFGNRVSVFPFLSTSRLFAWGWWWISWPLVFISWFLFNFVFFSWWIRFRRTRIATWIRHKCTFLFLFLHIFVFFNQLAKLFLQFFTLTAVKIRVRARWWAVFFLLQSWSFLVSIMHYWTFWTLFKHLFLFQMWVLLYCCSARPI